MLVFDTSALITAWRIHYPPATMPSVWRAVEQAIDAERIILPREVYSELEAKDDELLSWAKARRRRIVNPSAEVQQEVGPIAAMFPRRGIRDRADPWVIAEAKVRGFVVVTYEGTNASTGEPMPGAEKKMPGICKQLGIDCCIVPAGLTRLGLVI
jgi:hypothetical protein